MLHFARQILSVHPSVRLSVSDKSEHYENCERQAYGYYKEPREVTSVQFMGPFSDPLDHPFTQVGAHNPSQNLHRKLWPNGVRYDSGFY